MKTVRRVNKEKVKDQNKIRKTSIEPHAPWAFPRTGTAHSLKR